MFCFYSPNHEDEDGWYEFILKNFERQYDGTRAPFSVNMHEWYLAAYPAVFRALNRFIDTVTKLEDVFLVSVDKIKIRNQTNKFNTNNNIFKLKKIFYIQVNESDVVAWTKNPMNVEEYRTRSCRAFPPSPCSSPHVCTPISEHNSVSTNILYFKNRLFLSFILYIRFKVPYITTFK